MRIHNVGRAWRGVLPCACAISALIATAGAHAEDNWFGHRLLDAFAQDFQTPAYTSPGPDASPPPRRISPAPFDSPPFPSGDWQIGGAPIIGDPGNLAPWPLMEAIYTGPNRERWKRSRIQIYGWEDFSWNVSTSTNTSRGRNANFPLIYDLRPNRFEQNQFVLYIERIPDEFQTDHIDWGFRISGVYGLDYRFMISRGLFSDQLLTAQQLLRLRYADGLF